MRTAALLFAVCLAALFPAVAAADKPVIEPTPPTEDFVIEGACEFDVLLHTVADESKAIIFGERMIVTGKIKVRLTNVETGKTLDLNISGPGTFTFDEEDGTTTIKGGGPWLVWLLETDEGGPGIFLTRGHLTLVGDAEFNVLAFEVRGHVTDLCAALAP
jgi:hypothetical protein